MSYFGYIVVLVLTFCASCAAYGNHNLEASILISSAGLCFCISHYADMLIDTLKKKANNGS